MTATISLAQFQEMLRGHAYWERGYFVKAESSSEAIWLRDESHVYDSLESLHADLDAHAKYGLQFSCTASVAKTLIGESLSQFSEDETLGEPTLVVGNRPALLNRLESLLSK